jgi:uncharacterized protein (TIGR02996 family)
MTRHQGVLTKGLRPGLWLAALGLPAVLLVYGGRAASRPTGAASLTRAINRPAAGSGPAGQVRLVFVGDVMLDCLPGEAVAGGQDPFADFAPLFRQADLVVGNLECVIATGGERVDKPWTFRAHPRCVPLLARHFHALSLANNHTGDFGKGAFVEQLDRLRGVVGTFGGGRDLQEARAPLLLERHGVRIALLGYNEFKPRDFAAGPDTPGVAWSVDEQVLEDIRRARERRDGEPRGTGRVGRACPSAGTGSCRGRTTTRRRRSSSGCWTSCSPRTPAVGKVAGLFRGTAICPSPTAGPGVRGGLTMSSLDTAPAGLAQAFLDDIVAHPEDVGPRLVYADWLEDQGDAELAAFIRLPYGWRDRATNRKEWNRRHWLLLRLMGGVLSEGYRVMTVSNDDTRAGRPLSETTTHAAPVPYFAWCAYENHVCVVVRHGFVTEVGCPQGVFLDVAAGLFRHCPIADVRLFTRPAKVRDRGWVWARERAPGDARWRDAMFLDQRLYDHLEDGTREEIDASLAQTVVTIPSAAYPTVLDAHRALSATCVRWGRGQAAAGK